MQLQLIYLFLLLLILFFLSRKIYDTIYLLSIKIFRSNRLAVLIITLILLPGTIIHELSHLVTAFILRVPTGKFSLIPEIEDSGGVLLGHVEIGNSDPFRQSLIGLAPTVIGVILIYLTGIILIPNPGLLNITFSNILI